MDDGCVRVKEIGGNEKILYNSYQAHDIDEVEQISFEILDVFMIKIMLRTMNEN
jgi:hypothetical protein